MSHLSTDDLLLNVAHVSRQFNRLSKSRSVHIDVSIGYFVDKDKAAKFLRKTTLIRKLQFIWPTFWELNFSPDKNYIKKVNNFEICKYGNDSSDKLLLSLTSHCHLKILVCPFLSVTSQCLAQLRETKWWKRLTKIHLKNGDSAVEELGSEGCLKDLSLDIRMDELILNLITGPACRKLKNLEIHRSLEDDHTLSAIFDARKDTLEVLSLQYSDFEDETLEKLLSCKQLHTLILSNTGDSLSFLPNLKSLTTLNLDTEVQWDWRYNAEVPVNSLPNLRTLIIKMDVPDAEDLPDEDYQEHLEFYEEHRLEIKRYVLDLVRASPNLTVFDYHSDVQCVTAEAFSSVIALCP